MHVSLWQAMLVLTREDNGQNCAISTEANVKKKEPNGSFFNSHNDQFYSGLTSTRTRIRSPGW